MSRDEFLAALRRDLADLERYAREVGYDRFVRDRDAQNMVLFAVYRVSQNLIDLANLIVADRGLGVPQSYRDTFRLLAEAGILDMNLSPQLEGWAGLRNVIAHIYRKLDLDDVHRAFTSELAPVRSFLDVAAALLMTDTDPKAT